MGCLFSRTGNVSTLGDEKEVGNVGCRDRQQQSSTARQTAVTESEGDSTARPQVTTIDGDQHSQQNAEQSPSGVLGSPTQNLKRTDIGQPIPGSECLVDSKKGSVSIYKPPLKCVLAEEETGMAKYEVGAASDDDECRQQSYVILLVGATGVGKSTLVNGIANYVLGVRYEDPFRYKLIDEGAIGQAQSQTRHVASYTFHRQTSSPIPFTVTIIDTPGFGDTDGTERDKTILIELKHFFAISGFTTLNAVGFVTQAALARLTPTQSYIFDSMLSIFGNDISSSIVLMVTFADSKKPPVLEALRMAGVPINKCFDFNNSALYPEPDYEDTESNHLDNDLDKIFWDRSMSRFAKFFEELSHMEPKSLQQTKDVLEEREQLALMNNGLHQWGLMVVAKIEELKEEEMILKQHSADLDANHQFQYTVHVARPKQEDNRSGKSTNCTNCNFTCHEYCSCPLTEDKENVKCVAMEESTCRVCPGKCKLFYHTRSAVKYKRCIEKENRSSEALKVRYKQEAIGSGSEALIDKLRKEVEAQYYEAFLFIRHAHQTLNRLNALALKPKLSSSTECIDLLIHYEEGHREHNYQKRVERLKVIQGEAERLLEIKDNDEFCSKAQQSAQQLAKLS